MCAPKFAIESILVYGLRKTTRYQGKELVGEKLVLDKARCCPSYVSDIEPRSPETGRPSAKWIDMYTLPCLSLSLSCLATVAGRGSPGDRKRQVGADALLTLELRSLP